MRKIGTEEITDRSAQRGVKITSLLGERERDRKMEVFVRKKERECGGDVQAPISPVSVHEDWHKHWKKLRKR